MAKAFTHDPHVLYRASLERMNAAWSLFDEDDWPTAFYLGGLAVECVLQALALRDGAEHDARHDLRRWLAKCPPSVSDALKSIDLVQDWNCILVEWSNRTRYLDKEALLARLRHTSRFRRFKGDDEARLKQTVKTFLNPALRVHNQGVVQWQRDNKSSTL